MTGSAGLLPLPRRRRPVAPDLCGEPVCLLPEGTRPLGAAGLPLPGQLPEEGDSGLQSSLGEQGISARPRPEHQGRTLVQALEGGSCIARGLLEIELFRLQIIEGIRRAELVGVDEGLGSPAIRGALRNGDDLLTLSAGSPQPLPFLPDPSMLDAFDEKPHPLVVRGVEPEHTIEDMPCFRVAVKAPEA